MTNHHIYGQKTVAAPGSVLEQVALAASFASLHALKQQGVCKGITQTVDQMAKKHAAGS